MAEYDWSINWSSNRRHFQPHTFDLKVFVDGVEHRHVIRCLTGPDGVCVEAETNENGTLVADQSTGTVKTRVVFGDVCVVDESGAKS